MGAEPTSFEQFVRKSVFLLEVICVTFTLSLTCKSHLLRLRGNLELYSSKRSKAQDYRGQKNRNGLSDKRTARFSKEKLVSPKVRDNSQVSAAKVPTRYSVQEVEAKSE